MHFVGKFPNIYQISSLYTNFLANIIIVIVGELLHFDLASTHCMRTLPTSNKPFEIDVIPIRFICDFYVLLWPKRRLDKIKIFAFSHETKNHQNLAPELHFSIITFHCEFLILQICASSKIEFQQ